MNSRNFLRRSLDFGIFQVKERARQMGALAIDGRSFLTWDVLTSVEIESGIAASFTRRIQTYSLEVS